MNAWEAGEAVVFPTETVYGVGVRHNDPRAMALLRGLKGRDEYKPFQVLIADMNDAESLGARWSTTAERLANAFWPGPLTLVIPSDKGMIGLRLPDAPFLREAARMLGRAIVSSSANPAGLPAPTTAAQADCFGAGIAVLVDGGPCTGGLPSSVVRIDGNQWELLREGALGRDELTEAAGLPGVFGCNCT